MTKIVILFLVLNIPFLFCFAERSLIIESFESGYVPLFSYEDEDIEPDSFAFDTDNTANTYSVYSLKLFGNTWKTKPIESVLITENSVWTIDVFSQNVSDIQGFGISDGEKTLFYSFFGTEELNIEEWVPVYQGLYGTGQWVNFPLPVGSDWFAWYEEYPVISEIIFVNDADDNSGIVFFDNVLDITDHLPVAPEAEISYSIISSRIRENRSREVVIQFHAEITDPDSDEHVYYWDFGDGFSSSEAEPIHTYYIEDNHLYTVLLQILDDDGLWGYASCSVQLNPGTTNLPVRMNFVGDVMLARNLQGVINSIGLDNIFAPISPYLGEAADITVANLECPFTSANTNHPTKTIYFKAAPENMAAISHAMIDVVSLANNHTWDYLDAGMLETIQLLEAYQIGYGGAGMNSYEAYLPHFENSFGINTAFLFSCDRTGQYNNYQPYLQAGLNKPGFAYMTPYYVSKQIDMVRNVADVIVVNTHSGSEYSIAPGANYDYIDIFSGWDVKDFELEEDYTPRADIPHMWDLEIRRHFIDQGADIVICHHPHIIQGFEIYNGKLIAHSLGNFVFDLTYSETFPSMILNMNISENGLSDYTITPVFIDDFIPQRARGDLGLHILEYLAMKSRELNTFLKIDRENLIAEVIIDTFNMIVFSQPHNLETNAVFLQNEYYSPPVRLPYGGYISSLNSIVPDNNMQFRLGRELVWNGNFEDEGSTEWNLNSDFEWIDDTVSFSGERSLCLTRNSAQGYAVMTDLANRLKRFSSADYSVHGYIKTENVSSANIQVRYFSNRTGGNALGIGETAMATGTHEWQYFWQNISFEDGTNFFNINSILSPPDNGESFAWFDDIGVIEWTDWQEYTGFPEYVWNPNNYRFIQIKSTESFDTALINISSSDYNNPLVQFSSDAVPQSAGATLYDNFPNPFNPETTISFSLLQESNVQISIYNIRGQKVKQLVNDKFPQGKHFIVWNGKNSQDKSAASGIYFYRFVVDGKLQDQKKMLLLK